jgi:hypothetical protein
VQVQLVDDTNAQVEPRDGRATRDTDLLLPCGRTRRPEHNVRTAVTNVYVVPPCFTIGSAARCVTTNTGA